MLRPTPSQAGAIHAQGRHRRACPDRRPARRHQPVATSCWSPATAARRPEGVAPDMARAIAERLGVPVSYVPFRRRASSRTRLEGRLGHRPDRRRAAARRDHRLQRRLCEIEATYLVPAGSPIKSIDEVDRPGVRIAVAGAQRLRALARPPHQAGRAAARPNLDAAYEQFVDEKLDALAGLRPRLLTRRREAARRPHPRRPVHRGAAGDRHGAARTGRRRVPARLRRGGEGLGPRRPPDRAAQRGRPLGGAAGVSATPKRASTYFTSRRLEQRPPQRPPLSPSLRGEGWGEGRHQTPRSVCPSP